MRCVETSPPSSPPAWWSMVRAASRYLVRFTGLSIGLDLNWLPIKQSAYLTSLPLPVLSFPVPLNIPRTSISSLFSPPPSHQAPLHRHIHLSLSVIPPLPSPLRLRPSPHPHSVTSTDPLYLNPSLSITVQHCVLFLLLSFSHLSPDLIFALFLSYTFSQSIHQSLLK